MVFRDISERKESERQREAAFQEIKQLKEQVDQALTLTYRMKVFGITKPA